MNFQTRSKYPYFLLFLFKIINLDRSTAIELLGTSLVITLPAPIFEFFRIRKGAINEEFDPTEAEVEKAKKIVLAFDKAKKKGLSVVSLGSKMIDPPVVKRALNTINMAIINGLVSKSWKWK